MPNRIRVLLVDDDPDHYVLINRLLAAADEARYVLVWAGSYEEGAAMLALGGLDVALVDERLGDRTGLDLIRETTGAETGIPMILLTGQEDRAIHQQAIREGAADYIEDAELTPERLDRALRYAAGQRQALIASRGREERVRALIENSRDVIALLRPDGMVEFASDASAVVLGVEPAQLVGQHVFAHVVPEDASAVRTAFLSSLSRAGEPVPLEYRERRGDTVRDLEAILVNRIDTPAVQGIVATIRDLTERKRVEAEQAHLAAIVAFSSDAIIGTTFEGKVRSWNSGAERMYGYRAEEILGRSVAVLIPRSRIGEMGELLEHLHRGESVHNFETVRRRKSGDEFQVSLSLSPMFDAAGRVAGASSISRDISDRLRAEEALRESRERMQFALEAARVGVWDMDVDSGAVTWSESMARVVGIPRTSFPTTSEQFLALVHEDDRNRITEALRGAQSDDAFIDLQFRLRVGDEIRWHESRAKVYHRDGRRALIGIGLDVTDRRTLEEQLLQSQKMEAVGRLAGGVAHDFNNMLTVIQGYAGMLSQALGDGHAAALDVREIQAAAESAASLTRQLLAFSRKQVMHLQVLDLNLLVERVESLLRRLIGEDVELRTHLTRPLPAVRADPSQIEQVIMNLAVNARDAMPHGGRLTVETAARELDDTFVARHRGASQGLHVMVSVSDTGTGMDEATQTHLFEPFFTTKEHGKGTGLGLATVYGIVKQSGGSIWVYSEVGVGTTFKVYLPATADAPGEAPAAAPEVARLTGTETVLLAEDEEGVRMFTAEVLRRYGYTVLQAPDAREAQAIAASHPGDIHVLLTDVIMAGASGRELATAMRAERPAIRVLYMSGYTDDVIARHGVLEAGIAFLQKPFTSVTLLQRLRQVLDAPDAPVV